MKTKNIPAIACGENWIDQTDMSVWNVCEVKSGIISNDNTYGMRITVNDLHTRKSMTIGRFVRRFRKQEARA